MSDPRRLTDPTSGSSKVLRDMLRAARSDDPTEANLGRLAARLGGIVGAPSGPPSPPHGPPSTAVGPPSAPPAAPIAAGLAGAKLGAVVLAVASGAGVFWASHAGGLGPALDSRSVAAVVRQQPGAPIASVATPAQVATGPSNASNPVFRSPPAASASIPVPAEAPEIAMAAAPMATPEHALAHAARAHETAASIPLSAGRPDARDVGPEPAPASVVVSLPSTSTALNYARSEISLLQEAQSDLRVDPGRALSLVERDSAENPGGMLTQEREVIAIDALVRLGRLADARARARRFAERFPGSAHRSRVLALVEHADATSDHNR